jgi:Mg2+/citrate symporter
MTAIEEAAKRLRFLGTPLFRGLSDRPWPLVPWEGGMVRLGEELRLEGASVWYTVVGRRGKGAVVLFALEPRL